VQACQNKCLFLSCFVKICMSLSFVAQASFFFVSSCRHAKRNAGRCWTI